MVSKVVKIRKNTDFSISKKWPTRNVPMKATRTDKTTEAIASRAGLPFLDRRQR